LGIVQMIKLAKAAQNFKNLEIVSQTLPGRFADIDGISYWYVDPKTANEAVMALFRGETVDVVQGPTIIQNSKEEKEDLTESREAEESQNVNDNINVDANEVQGSSNVDNVSNTEADNVTSSEEASNITNEEIDNVTDNEETNIESGVNDAMADEEGWIPIPTS